MKVPPFCNGTLICTIVYRYGKQKIGAKSSEIAPIIKKGAFSGTPPARPKGYLSTNLRTGLFILVTTLYHKDDMIQYMCASDG